MKNESEIKKEVAQPFNDFVRIVLDNQELARQEGYESGLDDCDFDINDKLAEKIGVEYTVEAFKDCITLDDFEAKRRELTNLSCTFMPTTGLNTQIK